MNESTRLLAVVYNCCCTISLISYAPSEEPIYSGNSGPLHSVKESAYSVDGAEIERFFTENDRKRLH